MDLLLRLSTPNPAFLWGLLSRGIGLVYFVSFASLSWQVLPTAGRHGITPVADALRAIREHFPTWKRFFYFPSLLWIHDGDGVLGALPWVGMIAAASVVVGGPHAPWAFLVLYVVYLSLERPMVLVYPWDCMLFEAGLFSALLPATHALPEVSAVSAPLPAVAWVFRLLVFRVLFGFGKHKFAGKTKEDAGFLKSFFANQPLPTKLGWLVQKLPMPVHKLALLVMFVAEIPVPFLVFAPGPASAVGGLAIILLMLGIWLTGNFGYFNVLVIVASLSWFDTETALALRTSDFFSSGWHGFVHVLIAAHLFFALVAFPFNTFCAQTWMMWPVWRRLPGILTWPVALARVLHPLRWAHAYGVFPPRTPPAAKVLPILEATWDGTGWHTIQHKYSPTLDSSRPRVCAPHHNRVDQATVYEGLGLNEASVLRNFMGRWDPYGYGGVPGAQLLMQRMLEGNVPGIGFYDRTLERRHGRPLAVRARTFLFEPTSLEELRKTGNWWRRSLIGPHFPRIDRGHVFPADPLAPPELWHPDDIFWIERSKLGTLMRRAVRGEDPHRLVREPGDVTDADLARFWAEFVPACAPCRHDFHGARALAARLRERFGRDPMGRFQRLIGRYGALLFAKLEPLFLDGGLAPVFGTGKATLDVKSSFHVRLLAEHVIGEGREAYDAVMRNPLGAVAEAERMSMQSGLHFQVVLRYEALVYQAGKHRLLDAYDRREGRPEPSPKQRQAADRLDATLKRLFGSLDVAAFLRTQFTGEEDVLDTPENWPRFALLSDGEIVRVETHP